jgi:3D (Asp-Asp-Asp) domain-containing protein
MQFEDCFLGIAPADLDYRFADEQTVMKHFTITMAIAALLACPALAAAKNQPTVTTIKTTTVKTTVRKEAVQPQSLLARVTVYWAGGRGSDRYTRQHRSSTGLRLRQGHCAVDPRKIPYGSQVIFPDRTGLVAVDTGSAVRSRKAARRGGRTTHEKNAIVVDRFFETKGQALAWARRNPAFMTVQVVPPNYRAQSNTKPTMQARTGSQLIATNAPLRNTSASAAKRQLPVRKPGLRAL